MTTTHSINLIVKAIGEGKSVLVAGGGASGKTVFLDALLAKIPPSESALILEKVPELHRRASDRWARLPGPIPTSLKGGEKRVVIDSLRNGNEARAAFRFIEAGTPCLTTINASSPLNAWQEAARMAGVGLETAKKAFGVVAVMEFGKDGNRHLKTLVGA